MSIFFTCLFFLALLPNYAASITFNFTNISPQDSQDIVFSGDAEYTPDEGIRVTHGKNNNSFQSYWLGGRATYIKPLHLWDYESNTLASFSTSFTFIIDSYQSNYYADGFTFFLAQNNSLIEKQGSLGLPFTYPTSNSIYPFVAVEFDTYGLNEWDPKDPDTNKSIDDHVGIDVNNITSVVFRKWYSNITYGKECRALIHYSSASKTLSVSFTSFKDNVPAWETGLDYIIDLREVLPERVIFGFSASTGDYYEKHFVRSWTFNSTDFMIDENKGLAPTASLDVVKGESNVFRKVGLIVGPLVLVSIMAILAYFICRRKKTNCDEVEELRLALEMNNEFEMGASMPRRFSYVELARSTANFAETEKLGEGGFGGVYKGFVKDLSVYVAVKRVSKTSKQGIKEYASEVRIISRLRHKNLVQLTGWCHEKGELLLVYEFMANGSLDLHLFKGKSLLTWHNRYKIAQGLASALLYLHEEWEQCVLHRDIKSSNVMLDSNFNAKLGDFGLAKLVDHEKGSQTTILAGTLGYMAPECVVTGRATKESDVFSFGVVALEIACGRKVIDYMAQEKKIRLLEWVWELYGKGALLEAVDPSLGPGFEEEEITRLMIIGLWCVHPDSKLRPSMREAIKVLNSEASLPILPSKMPIASYLTSLVSSLSDFTSIGQYQSLSNGDQHLNTKSSKDETFSS
ncbi:hypothetical protein SSX86_005510 [Deinandra increscens subsp. villosa]|uniref:non-specific serine/threonine protein kinase n=1 Tax=Deinandra increscens subsp. villosa TaxID=3103831 RepID=A0AAP0H8K2_9ASTR